MSTQYKAWIVAPLLLATAAFQEARADVVVIVSAKNPASSLSADAISQIFFGRSTALKPFDNADKSTVRDEFYTKVAGKGPAQVKAIWAKLIFTGQGTPPKELGSNSEVVKAVAADPGAIGYVEKSAVDSSVKVILEAK
jgi:ABC-type phosphate transport system substrate-binding protein